MKGENYGPVSARPSDPNSRLAVDLFLADMAHGQRQGFYQATGKRIFDVAVSAFALVALAVPISFLLVLVSMDGGSPLFRHKRIGHNGKVFWCMKIRTMVVDADRRLADILARDVAAATEWAASHKLTDDPRVTKIGRVLRKTSLDELPQLIQVLTGEMSIVGPRPIVREEMVRYGPVIDAYLKMRPGLTGPWQATGRNSLTYDERVELDVNYAKSVSFLADIKIIVMTVSAVLKGTGK